MPGLGCGVQGSGFSLCFYREQPGGRGVYSNNPDVTGLFITLSEMKQITSRQLQESTEHHALTPVPVSGLETHLLTGAPGNGTDF